MTRTEQSSSHYLNLDHWLIYVSLGLSELNMCINNRVPFLLHYKLSRWWSSYSSLPILSVILEVRPTKLIMSAKQDDRLTRLLQPGGKIISFQGFLCFNSLWPSKTIWRQRSGSTLALVMAYGTKPWPKPVLTNHQWGLVAFNWGQSHRKCSRYLSLVWI